VIIGLAGAGRKGLPGDLPRGAAVRGMAARDPCNRAGVRFAAIPL